MDALKERVFEARIRLLQARLEVAVRQRDNFAQKFHEVTKTPYQERREDIVDCDAEIDRAGEPKDVRNLD